MKYYVNSEQELIDLKEDVETSPLSVGDIIVHKPYAFYEIVPLIKKHFNNAELFPASPGTDVYTNNGYNTSVVKTINETPDIIEP